MKEIAAGVTVDPAVRFGRPVVQGTRVPVDLVIRELANGMTPEEVGREYALTAEQIQAVLRYAADRVAEEEVAVL